ncbi:MAG: hypothetical protein R3A47_02885 [Polyangiales bacterium]
MQPFVRLEASIVFGRSELATLQQVSATESYFRILQDYGSMICGGDGIAFLRRHTEEKHADDPV